MTIEKGFVMLVGADGLGRGDEDLGRLLIHRFLHELGVADSKPEAMLFINSGVKLVADDSPALGQIKRLEELGTEVLACSTCLDRFGLMDRIAAGGRTDMGQIVSTLTKASRVLST